MRSARLELILDTLRAVRGARDLSKATDDVAKSLGDTAREGDRAAHAVDGAGGEMTQAARAAAGLDREIEKLNGSLREMAISQALTGDSFTKQIRAQEGEVRRLSRNRKLLGDFGDQSGEAAAVGFAARFSQRIGPLIASGPGVAIAGTAIGVAMAPTIAAAIGAGIAGGVGAAGIIGGITLVAKDPLVAAAGKDVGTRFAAGVTAEAQSFRTPVLDALKQIDAAAARTVPKIGEIFRNTAPSVDRLTGSVIHAGEAITNSLVVASSRSSGPLGALGHMVESVGVAVGGLITNVTSNSRAGVSALNDLTMAMTNTIQASSMFLRGMADIKGGLDHFDNGVDSVRFSIEDFFTKLAGGRTVFDITADGYKKGTAAAELYRKGVIGASGSINDYNHYAAAQASATSAVSQATHTFIMDTAKADPVARVLVGTLNAGGRAALGQRDALVQLSNQLRAQVDPAFALIEAQRSLRTAQDNAAAATKKHGRNSDEARTATRALALAALDMQAKAGALSTTFNGKLSPSMLGTLRAAGLTKSQINAVAREFRDAKRDGDKYAKNYKAQVSVTGQIVVNSELWRLSLLQQALKNGNAPPAAYGALNKTLRGARMASGGEVPGTSPHKRADNIPAMLTAREWVQPVDSVDYYGAGVMSAIQHRRIPAEDLKAVAAYAGGGQVGWPYPVTASKTRIPSLKEVMSKVAPAVPTGGQTLDFMVRAVHAAFPGMRLISGYRPGAHTLSGSLSYHALRRASDWPASRPLAEWINARYFGRTKELITPWNDLNIHNGRRHTYTGAVFRQHNFAGGNAHDHWAMANGGVLREPVFGYGTRTGATYSLAERGPERVIPERQITAAGTGGRGGGNTYVTVQAGYVVSEQQLENKIAQTLDRLKYKGRA